MKLTKDPASRLLVERGAVSSYVSFSSELHGAWIDTTSAGLQAIKKGPRSGSFSRTQWRIRELQ